MNTENLEHNMNLEAEEDITSAKEDDSDEEVKFGRHKVGKRNLTQLDNIALASIRYGVDDRPTAAIVSATLVDFGVITKDDQQMVTDQFKIRRAKERVMSMQQEAGEKKNLKEKIQYIFFDGR